MLIDSHAHLEWDSYKDDFEAVLQRAKTQNVNVILNIGTTLEHSQKSVELANRSLEPSALGMTDDLTLGMTKNAAKMTRDPREGGSDIFEGIAIYAAIGIHPHEAAKVPEDYLEQLKNMAKNPSVKAIGEVGLDYFYKNADPVLQKKRFEEQIQLAKALNLPLSIHCREAFQEAFEILDRTQYFKGVFHCFTGTIEEAKEAIKRGFYISISGIITFKKAAQLQQVVQNLPLEKLLIETDCPFLAPEPYRGKRNEPAYVIYTAKKIAELLGVSLEEVAAQTTTNTKTLFGI